MRLTEQQTRDIRRLAHEVAGDTVRVRVFGSRLDDRARGGDVDLLVELDQPVENPALLSARLAARISRLMNGRHVDVLLDAPNLMRQAIHDIARLEGRLL